VTAGDPGEITGFLAFDLGADGSGWDQLIIPAGGGRRPVPAAPEPHEGYIIEHAAKRLCIPEERVFNNLERYGNIVRYEPLGAAA
jgi:3-oxoacyl-[acyl-carrier-protein] synthase III